MKLPPEDLPLKVEADCPESVGSEENQSQFSGCFREMPPQYIKRQNDMLSDNYTTKQEENHKEATSVNCGTLTKSNEQSDNDIDGSVRVKENHNDVHTLQHDINSLESRIQKIDLTPEEPRPKYSDKFDRRSAGDAVNTLEEDFQKIELTPKGPGKVINGGIIAGVPSNHNHLLYHQYNAYPQHEKFTGEHFPYSNNFPPRHESIAPGRRKRDDDGYLPYKYTAPDGFQQAVSDQLCFPPNSSTQQASMGRAFPCENADDSLLHESNLHPSSNILVKETLTRSNPSHMSGGSVLINNVPIVSSGEDLAELIDSMNYGPPESILPEPKPNLDPYPIYPDNIINGQDCLPYGVDIYQPRKPDNYQNYPTTQPLPPNQPKNGSFMLYKDHDSFDSNQGDTKSEGYGTESNASPYSEAQSSPENSLTHDSPINSPQSVLNYMYNSPPPTNLSLQSEDSGIAASPLNERTQKIDIEENGLDGRQEELSDVLETIANDLSQKNSQTHSYAKVISRPHSGTSQHVASTLNTVGVNRTPSCQPVSSGPRMIGGHMPTSGVKQLNPPASKPVVIFPPAPQCPQAPQQLILIPVTQPQQPAVFVPVVKPSKKQQAAKKVNRPPREIRPKPVSNPPDSVPTESIKLPTSDVRHTADPSMLTTSVATSVVKLECQKSAVQSLNHEVPKSSSSWQSVQRQQPETRINLARRCVAELKTERLLYQDDDLDTYLHVSIYKADKFMVQALLERLERENLQYMMDAKNSLMQTPLYMAVSVNQPEMVRLLIQHNVDVNVYAQVECGEQKAKFQGAIHYAASKGIEYLSTLNQLLTAPDIKIDLTNSEGKTALHCAILAHLRPSAEGSERINSIPVVETLMRSGADPNAQDINSGNAACGGKTPLMYAVETKDVKLLESMVKLIDPANMPKYLRTSTYNGFTVLKILESLKLSFKEETWMYIRNLFYRMDRQENCVKVKNSK